MPSFLEDGTDGNSVELHSQDSVFDPRFNKNSAGRRGSLGADPNTNEASADELTDLVQSSLIHNNTIMPLTLQPKLVRRDPEPSDPRLSELV